MTDGATDHPAHDEDRARREFRLLSGEEAKAKARERLRRWLETHPGARVNYAPEVPCE